MLRNWPQSRVQLLLCGGALFPFLVGLTRYLSVLGTPDIRFIEHVAYTNLTAVGALSFVISLSMHDLSWRPVARTALKSAILLWSAGNDLFIIVRLTVQAPNAPWLMPLPLFPLTVYTIGLFALCNIIEAQGHPQIRWVRRGLASGLILIFSCCGLLILQGPQESTFQRSSLYRNPLTRRCPTTPERVCCISADCRERSTCPTLSTECYGQDSVLSCYQMSWKEDAAAGTPPQCQECFNDDRLQREVRRCE